MKRLFIFMPLVVLIFLSPLAKAQISIGPCTPTITDYPLLMSCISTTKGPPLFYSIEVNQVQSQFMCDLISSKQEANVMVTDEQGNVVDSFLLQEYQFAFGLKTKGSYFQSYDKKLFLSECMYYQGGGQGGFSVGN